MCVRVRVLVRVCVGGEGGRRHSPVHFHVRRVLVSVSVTVPVLKASLVEDGRTSRIHHGLAAFPCQHK